MNPRHEGRGQGVLSEEARVSDGPVTAPEMFGLSPGLHFLLLLSLREMSISAGFIYPGSSVSQWEGTGGRPAFTVACEHFLMDYSLCAL